MDFQQNTPSFFHSGANTQAGDAFQRLVCQAVGANGKDTHGGRFGVTKSDIEGAAIKAAAQFLTMHDMAADGVGAAQHGGDGVHVPVGQGLAHQG